MDCNSVHPSSIQMRCRVEAGISAKCAVSDQGSAWRTLLMSMWAYVPGRRGLLLGQYWLPGATSEADFVVARVFILYLPYNLRFFTVSLGLKLIVGNRFLGKRKERASHSLCSEFNREDKLISPEFCETLSKHRQQGKVIGCDGLGRLFGWIHFNIITEGKYPCLGETKTLPC